jgi:hypothetical protein
VAALHLRPRRWARFARLDAVLGDGERVKIVGGRAGRIRALAGWLADRADLPLTGNTPGVIGMTVASRQVSR